MRGVIGLCSRCDVDSVAFCRYACKTGLDNGYSYVVRSMDERPFRGSSSVLWNDRLLCKVNVEVIYGFGFGIEVGD